MNDLNASIVRAKPVVWSPLAKLIKGEIDQAEYERQMEAKRRFYGLPPLPVMTNAIAGPQTATPRGVR